MSPSLQSKPRLIKQLASAIKYFKHILYNLTYHLSAKRQVRIEQKFFNRLIIIILKIVPRNEQMNESKLSYGGFQEKAGTS